MNKDGLCNYIDEWSKLISSNTDNSIKDPLSTDYIMNLKMYPNIDEIDIVYELNTEWEVYSKDTRSEIDIKLEELSKIDI